MRLFGPVTALFAGDEVVHECRRCGTTVEATTAVCPCCGLDDIARYEIR